MEPQDQDDELGQLARNVQKLVQENRRFLDRIMTDDCGEEDAEPDEEQPHG